MCASVCIIACNMCSKPECISIFSAAHKCDTRQAFMCAAGRRRAERSDDDMDDDGDSDTIRLRFKVKNAHNLCMISS